MKQKPAPKLYHYRKRTVLFFFHIYLQVPEPVYPVFFKVIFEYLLPHIHREILVKERLDKSPGFFFMPLCIAGIRLEPVQALHIRGQ